MLEGLLRDTTEDRVARLEAALATAQAAYERESQQISQQFRELRAREAARVEALESQVATLGSQLQHAHDAIAASAAQLEKAKHGAIETTLRNLATLRSESNRQARYQTSTIQLQVEQEQLKQELARAQADLAGERSGVFETHGRMVALLMTVHDQLQLRVRELAQRGLADKGTASRTGF